MPSNKTTQHDLSYFKKSASLFLKNLRSSDLSKQKEAIARLQQLRSFSKQSEQETLENIDSVQHKHALTLIALEAGYSSWLDLKRNLELDFQEFFGHPRFIGYLNFWFPNYQEAKTFLRDEGGYLFPYRHQFFVAQEGYVKNLGLDPLDDAWEKIEYDWAVPKNPKTLEYFKNILSEKWQGKPTTQSHKKARFSPTKNPSRKMV